MVKPTVDDIITEARKSPLPKNNAQSSLLVAATEKILHANGVETSHSFTQDFTYYFPMSYMDAYALASKAYDALVKEREERPVLSDAVANAYLTENVMSPVPSLEKLLTNHIITVIVTTFLHAEQKPRRIVMPIHGKEYSLLLQTINQEDLQLMLDTFTPKPYIVEKLEVEHYPVAIGKETIAWKPKIGEVRVKFGVRER